jgi:hypothetical protein
MRRRAKLILMTAAARRHRRLFRQAFETNLLDRAPNRACYIHPECRARDHQLVVRMLDDAGLQENCRHTGGAEDDEIVELVDATHRIDDLPAFSLDRLRMMYARALAGRAQLCPDADREVFRRSKEAVPGRHEK